MSNKKKPSDKLKKKLSIALNEEILNKLDDYLTENDIPKRSKYIEDLIRKDMEDRGMDISRDF